MAIGSAVLVAGWLGVVTHSVVSGDGDAAMRARQGELARMQAQIAAMKSETTALKSDVALRAAALEQRQAFLAELLAGKRDMAKLAGMLPRATTDNPAATVAALVPPTVALRRGRKGVSAPVAASAALDSAITEPFRQLEASQLALVDQAGAAAVARLKGTEALVRRLGLDPDRFTGTSNWNGTAVGGPYIPATAEPRFKDLFLSWNKLTAIKTAIAAIPAFQPVRDYRYTSDFGFRFDPFNGGSAMHQGIDMAGAHGEPIYAAAAGTVNKAGSMNGYGNLIELRHGKGLDTRYGHLSKILVRPGEFVRQGQLIGRMGSTGRSTGTHLHYEIRVDGQAVNPKPFLDASAYVLAAQNGNADTSIGPPRDTATETATETAAMVVAGANMTPIPSLR